MKLPPAKQKRRGRKPARAATVAKLPSPAEVPDWSAPTLTAFEDLTPLERAFVEWYVTGMNAAEAYRRSTGAEYEDRETDTTRNNGYAIRSRPHVQAAIDAAMKDINFDARMNRAWMLQRLQVAMDKAEADDSPKAQASVAKIIKTIAELKGEIVKRSEIQVSEVETPAMKRFRIAVERATALASGLPDPHPPTGPTSQPAALPA